MSRQENSNQFKDGLLMDLHPLQTPNTVLTDCINGTFITYNGNEYALQNDMGNLKLKNCRLKPGYMPIGSASYADTIYLLSYNPINKNVELGCYPAPVQYNGNDGKRQKQLLGTLENYVHNLIAQQETNPVSSQISESEIDETIHNIDYTDLLKYTQIASFSEKELELKRGDMYKLSHSNPNICAFEELVYQVVLESGKVQRFYPTIADEYSGMSNVSWDSPGNIQISTKLFEIEKSDYRICSTIFNQQSIEHTILYELFVSDSEFIQYIKNQNELLFDTSKPNYIGVDCQYTYEDSSFNISHEIKKITISDWIGDYKKIAFLIQFTIPYKSETESVKIPHCNFTIIPYFRTSLSFFQNDANQSNILKFKINYNTHKITYDQTFDAKNAISGTIGNSVFKWTKVVEDWNIHLDSTIISGTELFGYCKKINLDPNDYSFSQLSQHTKDWKHIDVEKEENGIFTIALSEMIDNYQDNELYMWYFKRLPVYHVVETSTSVNEITWTKLSEENLIVHRDVFDSDTPDYNPNLKNEDYEWVEFPDNEFYVKIGTIRFQTPTDYCDLRELEDETDMYIYPMISYPCDDLYQELFKNTADERYDRIPFDKLFKKWLNVGNSKPSVSLDFNAETINNIFTNDDIKKFEKVKGFDTKEYSTLHNYFERYNNPEIFYPSVFEYGKILSEEHTLNVNVRKNVNVSVESDYNLPENKSGIFESTSAPYLEITNGYTTVKSDGTNSVNINIWNKLECEVVQEANTFYFADKVHFYEIKTNQVGNNLLKQFYICNREEPGNLDNNFTNTWILQEHDRAKNGSADVPVGKWFKWNSLETNNYRAIRMGKNSSFNQNPSGLSYWFESGKRRVDSTNQMDFFSGTKKIEGICQYIGEFHEGVRKLLDDNWKTIDIKTASLQIKSRLGECNINNPVGEWVYFQTRSFYRDKAMRATYSNNANTSRVNVLPEWSKWNKEAVGSGKDKGVSAESYFLALPYRNDVTLSSESKNWIVNGNPKLQRSYDYEDWKFISASEQHSNPKILRSDEYFDAIGLIYQETRDVDPGLIVAFVPGEQDARYKKHSCTNVTLSNYLTNRSNSESKYNIYVDIPANIKTIFKKLNEDYPKMKSDIVLITNEKQAIYDDQIIWDDNLFKNEDIDTFKNNIGNHIQDDFKNLQQHPVFGLFINSVGDVDRIMNYPVAGVYPALTEGVINAFEGATGFKAWKYFYVEVGQGENKYNARPFLIEKDDSNNIWVCKKGVKQTFGYWPYFPIE